MSQAHLQAAATQAARSGRCGGGFGEASQCLIDDSYRPIYDTVERRGAGDFRQLAFPEGAREGADRYAQTFAALESVAPHCLLVTHGFGVQAIAELVGGAEVFECDYCALTSLRRPDGRSQWTCGALCDASHLSGLDDTSDGGAKGEGDAQHDAVDAETRVEPPVANTHAVTEDEGGAPPAQTAASSRVVWF